MKPSEIFESPKLIAPEDWGLAQRGPNLALYNRLTSSNLEEIADYPTAKLVQSAGQHGGEIALLSKEKKVVEYYVIYEIASLKQLGHSATQVKVWRSDRASVTGLASKVFNDILLARFDTMVSDSLQTALGTKFWEGRLAGSRRSKTVGIMIGSEIHVYDPRSDFDTWIDGVDGWGGTDRYKRRRFFISNLSAEQITSSV